MRRNFLFTTAVSVIIAFALSLFSVAQAAGNPPDHAGNKTIPAVKITKVKVDKDAGTITITGKNFARRDFIQVELGGDPVALELISISDTEIVALIPGVLEPGDYLLEVITAVPPNAGSRDDFDMTVPE